MIVVDKGMNTSGVPLPLEAAAACAAACVVRLHAAPTAPRQENCDAEFRVFVRSTDVTVFLRLDATRGVPLRVQAGDEVRIACSHPGAFAVWCV